MALLNVSSAIGIWLVFTSAPLIFLLPRSSKGYVWILQLIVFNNLNLFIAFCEIALGAHIQTIKKDYMALRETYKGKEFEACVSFLTMPLSISQCFQGATWSRMWSTYSLYDPSYQNHESFGFFVDVGNGYSTILPGLLMNAAIVFPHRVSYLLVGCVGIASYWQIMYGTIIYILSFWFNERQKGRNALEIYSFVYLTNAFWMWGPSIGIYYCVVILRDSNLSVFESI